MIDRCPKATKLSSCLSFFSISTTKRKMIQRYEEICNENVHRERSVTEYRSLCDGGLSYYRRYLRYFIPNCLNFMGFVVVCSVLLEANKRRRTLSINYLIADIWDAAMLHYFGKLSWQPAFPQSERRTIFVGCRIGKYR